jgi:hypothetical protein
VTPEAQLRAVAAARRWCVAGALATVLDYDERLEALDSRLRALKATKRGGRSPESVMLKAEALRLFAQRDDPHAAGTGAGTVGKVVARAGRDGRLQLLLPSDEMRWVRDAAMLVVMMMSTTMILVMMMTMAAMMMMMIMMMMMMMIMMMMVMFVS